MAPRDPRLRPALEVSWPADADPAAPARRGSGWDLRLVLFGDGEWHRVTVRAWRTDKAAREVIDVEWRAAGSTWSESYLFNAERVRETPRVR